MSKKVISRKLENSPISNYHLLTIVWVVQIIGITPLVNAFKVTKPPCSADLETQKPLSHPIA
jgi:hypothetical protein